jgi:hypothetical protein
VAQGERIAVLDAAVAGVEQLEVGDGGPGRLARRAERLRAQSQEPLARVPASIQIARIERSASAWAGTMRTGSQACQRAQTSSSSTPVAGSIGWRTVPSGSAEQQAAIA